MHKPTERYYLAIANVRDQDIHLYDAGSHYASARVDLVKLQSAAQRKGLYPRFIGPDMLIVYDELLSVRAVIKLFLIAHSWYGSTQK